MVTVVHFLSKEPINKQDINNFLARGNVDGYVPLDERDDLSMYLTSMFYIERSTSTQIIIYPPYIDDFLRTLTIGGQFMLDNYVREVTLLTAILRDNPHITHAYSHDIQTIAYIDDYAQWVEAYAAYLRAKLYKINYNFLVGATCYCSRKTIKICKNSASEVQQVRREYPLRILLHIKQLQTMILQANGIDLCTELDSITFRKTQKSSS